MQVMGGGGGGGGEFTPRCAGHGERCRRLTVKKPGKNHGRSFFACPRAEGEKSNAEANCGFFMWADERRNAVLGRAPATAEPAAPGAKRARAASGGVGAQPYSSSCLL